mgnify:CR=1 FL=1
MVWEIREWIRFGIRKLAKLLILLAAVSFVSFVLVHYSPVDPVQTYIGADLTRVGPEQREQIAEYWGLERPLLERYGKWALSLLQGDMGTSLIYRQPVANIIAEGFMNSCALMLLAWLLSGVIGFAAGVWAAMKEGTLADRLIRWGCYLIASTPAYWIGLLLMAVFAVSLGWFPIGLGVPIGVTADEVAWTDRLRHMILPALTLSLAGMAPVAIHTREKLVEVLNSDYVLFARARGEEGFRLVWRHGLRNVAFPALSLQFASFSELFGGAMLAEQVFSYPGIGKATVEAGLGGDVPLLLGIVLFTTLFVHIGNTLADACYKLVDPRIRERRER